MSGLLALLDDVAGIARMAAASIDDVAAQAGKAGVKVAGAVIDDAAVTPAYVEGFPPSRELPMVWRIARGSLINKLVILLPVALLLSAFAPWAIPPLLMLGGAYLCFEGAEKVWHLFHHPPDAPDPTGPVAHLEEARVKGAIKTDFILSAEIMTIGLAGIPADDSIVLKAAILVLVGAGVTVAVYGFVALIVRADDFGLSLIRRGGAGQSIGRAILRMVPGFMRGLTTVGTAAMIWVGGSIVIHGLASLGLHGPADWIDARATTAAHAISQARAVVHWVVTAALDGVLGLALGLALLPTVNLGIAPLWQRVAGR